MVTSVIKPRDDSLLKLNEILPLKLIDMFSAVRNRAKQGYTPASGPRFVDARAKLVEMSECTYAKKQGVKFDAENTHTGTVTATMIVDPKKHTNPNGMCHGGAIAGFIDSALAGCAETVRQHEDEKVVTNNFNIHFLNPAMAGDTLTAIAAAEKVGKQVVHVNVRVFKNLDKPDDMKLVATASGDCTRIHPAQPPKIQKVVEGQKWNQLLVEPAKLKKQIAEAIANILKQKP